jgi:HIRAN domain
MTVQHRIGSPFTVKVVGMTFTSGYPENLYSLDYLYKERAQDHGALLDEPIAAVLIRNPDNPHDANAIEVHVPSLSDPMIGHIPAGVAARLAPELDEGANWLAGVEQVLIHPDHPDNPGIAVRLERVEDA